MKKLFSSLALFCAAAATYAQGVDTIVEIPTAAYRSALVEIPIAQTTTASSSDQDLTMAGEYKSTKNVVEEQKPVCWNWYADFGYVSEYNFRGTNLTPDADGALFANVDVSKWGFTLGATGYLQLGTARAPSFSTGEGGGGGTGGVAGSGGGIVLGPYFPETVQTRFEELDVFLLYHREFGPIDVTVGNIGFFIERTAETFLTFPEATPLVFRGTYGPYPTVGNERFDRAFVKVGTYVIPHVQPWITYYQTLYNDGQDHRFYEAGHIPANGTFVFYGNRFNDNFHERNDELGGYLEGRLRGNFPIGEWVDFNPFGVISYSFHDRTEPVPDAIKFKDTLRGRSLVGWNVAQAGLELPIHLFHMLGSSSGPCAPPDLHVDLVPGFTYSHHISRPTAGTDRDEIFGGAKLAITF